MAEHVEVLPFENLDISTFTSSTSEFLSRVIKVICGRVDEALSKCEAVLDQLHVSVYSSPASSLSKGGEKLSVLDMLRHFNEKTAKYWKKFLQLSAKNGSKFSKERYTLEELVKLRTRESLQQEKKKNELEIAKIRQNNQSKIGGEKKNLEAVKEEQNQDEFALLALTLEAQQGFRANNCKTTLGILRNVNIAGKRLSNGSKSLDAKQSTKSFDSSLVIQQDSKKDQEVKTLNAPIVFKRTSLETLALLERYMTDKAPSSMIDTSAPTFKKSEIQLEYFKLLDQNYNKEKFSQSYINQIKAKAARRIQRVFRLYIKEKKQKVVTVIQRAWRRFSQKKNESLAKLNEIRSRYLLKVLKKFLRMWIKKRKISKCRFKPEINYQSASINRIVKIQALVRGSIVRHKLIPIRKKMAQFKKDLHVNSLFFETPGFMTILKGYNTKETEFFQDQLFLLVEQQKLKQYCEKQEEAFEERWRVYEERLGKYCMSKTGLNLRDWIQQTSEEGVTTWVNLKTLKTQMEHPAKRFLEANRKALLNKAEEMFRARMEMNLRRLQEIELSLRELQRKKKKRLREERIIILSSFI